MRHTADSQSAHATSFIVCIPAVCMYYIIYISRDIIQVSFISLLCSRPRASASAAHCHARWHVGGMEVGACCVYCAVVGACCCCVVGYHHGA
jgi:hypothetical protein